jgi:hypothetical protein
VFHIGLQLQVGQQEHCLSRMVIGEAGDSIDKRD